MVLLDSCTNLDVFQTVGYVNPDHFVYATVEGSNLPGWALLFLLIFHCFIDMKTAMIVFPVNKPGDKKISG